MVFYTTNYPIGQFAWKSKALFEKKRFHLLKDVLS